MAAVREQQTWRRSAACIGVDPRIFFSDDKAVTAKALEICAGCKVRNACRLAAIRSGELGIWGGSLEHERRHSLYRRASVQ